MKEIDISFHELISSTIFCRKEPSEKRIFLNKNKGGKKVGEGVEWKNGEWYLSYIGNN